MHANRVGRWGSIGNCIQNISHTLWSRLTFVNGLKIRKSNVLFFTFHAMILDPCKTFSFVIPQRSSLVELKNNIKTFKQLVMLNLGIPGYREIPKRTIFHFRFQQACSLFSWSFLHMATNFKTWCLSFVAQIYKYGVHWCEKFAVYNVKSCSRFSIYPSIPGPVLKINITTSSFCYTRIYLFIFFTINIPFIHAVDIMRLFHWRSTSFSAL